MLYLKHFGPLNQASAVIHITVQKSSIRILTVIEPDECIHELRRRIAVGRDMSMFMATTEFDNDVFEATWHIKSKVRGVIYYDKK